MKEHVLSLIEAIGSSPQTAPAIVRERCLRRRLNTCDCRLCLNACAAGALSLVDRQVVLDEGKCTGCLRCVAVCPNESLVAAGDLEEIMRKAAGRTRLYVSCFRQKPRFADEVPVPCLGLFSEEMLLALGRSGCKMILFNTDGCATCCNKSAAEQFLAALRLVLTAASEFLTGELSLAADTASEEQYPQSRRTFLANVRAGMTFFVRERQKNSAPGQPGQGRRLPFRVRLVDSLLAKAEGKEKSRLHALITPTLKVTDACTTCPRCTGICPTGALRTDGTGPGKRLIFAASRCSTCGLCVAFCKEAALSLTPSPLIAGKEGASSFFTGIRKDAPSLS